MVQRLSKPDTWDAIVSSLTEEDVRRLERAVEIAARISVSPGPGGELVNIPVELHTVPPRPA